MKLFKHSIWEVHFVNYSYYRSSTATDPIWKTFKRFPVEPSVEYVSSLNEALQNGDFDQRDILIEIINLQYEMEDLKKEGHLSTYLEFAIDKEIKNLALLSGITL